jgi:hypothetical protein
MSDDAPKTELTNVVPEGQNYRDLKENGQQRAYVVLSAEERAKGFVRPLRHVYTHNVCGTDTRMGNSIAETYARDPYFYGGTFCAQCGKHFPLGEFVWKGTAEQVGS